GHKNGAAPRPLKTFKPPVVRDDRWFRRPGYRRPRPRDPNARRRWQPQTSCQHQASKDVGDPRRMAAVSVESKATSTMEGTPPPPFLANGLSFLMEFHKDHSAIDLYGMTPENSEIVELALKNAKVEGLLITKGSDSAIKAVYQANREANARGMSGYRPDQGRLKDKAPFSRSDLEYLRQYFTMTPADTIFGLDNYLVARDALAKARRALEEEVEASGSPEIKASAYGTPGTARPVVKGHDDPFFGHEAEDDPELGISNEEYERILGMVKEKTLAMGGRE
ncbi:unnamed protein product, partial [Prunus brigantina]